MCQRKVREKTMGWIEQSDNSTFPKKHLEPSQLHRLRMEVSKVCLSGMLATGLHRTLRRALIKQVLIHLVETLNMKV